MIIIEVSPRRKTTKRLIGTIQVTLSNRFSQLGLGKKSRAFLMCCDESKEKLMNLEIAKEQCCGRAMSIALIAEDSGGCATRFARRGLP